METRQLLGITGAAVLFLAVFAPADSLPLIGTTSFVGRWNEAGVILLALAALTLGIAIYDKCRWLWLTGGASMAVILATGLHYLLGERVPEAMPRQWHWGWALLIAGAAIITAAAAWHEWSERS